MTTSLSLDEDISELIQCTICIELLSDTRVLRCGHTFCLRCLQRYSKGKAPGDSVACPVCRTQFEVPSGGVASLPRNFLLEKILEIYATSLLAEETLDDWKDKIPSSEIRQRSVAVQSTQTTSTSTVDTTTQENPSPTQSSNGMQQVQQRQEQHQQQLQQTQQQHQRQQQQQQRQQTPVAQRRRPFATRNGLPQRLLLNAFLISLVLNFLLSGNLWFSLASIEQEKRNWTKREMDFEETMQKLQQKNEINQITIDNHHLRCTERVEQSLDACKNDLTFYKGLLQTVSKLLDSHTTPQQPTFSVM